MAPNPIIFAMANPDPEITPEDAPKARDDVIIATGRSDYPNQVNNVLGFPYIFRGALDVRAKTINMEMKIAAAHALAELAREDVPDEVAAAYRGARPRFGPRLHHPGAVRSAPHPRRADRGGQGGDGFGRRAAADRRHGRLQGAAVGAARSDRRRDAARSSSACAAGPSASCSPRARRSRSIRAAYSFVNQGLGTAILVGREDRVRAVAEQPGFDLADKGIEIHNAAAFAPQRASTRNSSTSGCSGAATCCATASA